MNNIFIKWKDLFKKSGDNEDNSYSFYHDLAPTENLENGDEYISALHWALSQNEKIMNIAISGPYGSGKSSIIKGYLKKYPCTKFINVSLANFENCEEFNKNGTDKFSDEEIEIEILKQLFYKVKPQKIPYSRYRKLHKISFIKLTCIFYCMNLLLLLFISIISQNLFITLLNGILATQKLIGLSRWNSMLFQALILLIFSLSLALLYQNFISHFVLKKAKVIGMESEIESISNNDNFVFNKNIDEIIYFFEELDYNVVFFEDLDRLKNSKILIHLRELNKLLNDYEGIKHSIKFVYAVCDDIFKQTDRTKFFDFIIPVIPIINSTNSAEILLKLLSNENATIKFDITKEYIFDIAPYISDMRLLENTVNEFVLYKKILQSGQSLNLKDENMFSLILFKNLDPCEFSNLQNEQGIVKDIFNSKKCFIENKINEIEEEIKSTIATLNIIDKETLTSRRELKVSMLSSFSEWKGCTYSLTINGKHYLADEFMADNFDINSIQHPINSINCSYRAWNNNGGSSNQVKNPNNEFNTFLSRWNAISIMENEQQSNLKRKISDLKDQESRIKSASLEKLIEEFNLDEILDIADNKFLRFMFRRGYINEKYADYINYFKGNSITLDDKNFILSIKNREQLEANYSLTKIDNIVYQLQDYEFKQKEIYNFDLLEFLLSTHAYDSKLQIFIGRLSDGSDVSWQFINEFVDITKNIDRFISLLANTWTSFWKNVYNNSILTYERQLFYFIRIISVCNNEMIQSQNVDNSIIDFATEYPDFLQKVYELGDEKLINLISILNIKFRNITAKHISNKLLDFIFKNNYYELNQDMVKMIVERKNSNLISDLPTKNYSTLLKLKFQPLLDYIDDSWEEYVNDFALNETNTKEELDVVLLMIEKSYDDNDLCDKIISHQDCVLDDFEKCKPSNFDNDNEGLQLLWNIFLKENKIICSWKNISIYSAKFPFTEDLCGFIDRNYKSLLNEQAIVNDNFIKSFIKSDLSDQTFATLITKLPLEKQDYKISDFPKKRVEIMISKNYFSFSEMRYTEIKQKFPDLCSVFILHNQEEFLKNIDSIALDENLFLQLISSSEASDNFMKIIIRKYGNQYMNKKFVDILVKKKLPITKEMFFESWKYSDNKEELMYEYLDLLDDNDFEKCFKVLSEYQEFLDRTKQHTVIIEGTEQNLQLLNRLKEVDYITSYKEVLKHDKVFEGSGKKFSCIIKRRKA